MFYRDGQHGDALEPVCRTAYLSKLQENIPENSDYDASLGGRSNYGPV